MKQFRLAIYTPFGKKYDAMVDFVQVQTDKAFLGILPGHIDLISDVLVSKVIIRTNGADDIFATGEGVISVEKGNVKLMVDSFESKEEIDINRAEQAKTRAEDRLNNNSHEEFVDIERAKAALARALNRIEVAKYR